MNYDGLENPIPNLSGFKYRWVHPDASKFKFSNTHVIITLEDWNLLEVYSNYPPAVVYEGKIWRSGPFLCWYENDPDDSTICIIKSLTIAIEAGTIAEVKRVTKYLNKPIKKNWISRILKSITK